MSDATSSSCHASFKDVSRGIFGRRCAHSSRLRSSVRRRFLHGNFERIPTLLTNVPIPSSSAGDAFLSLDELAAATARLPTLVTKTNGMYLFHGTPASGFLLSPLCIALVKHFFPPLPSLPFDASLAVGFSSPSLLPAIFFVLFLSSFPFRLPPLLLSSFRSFLEPRRGP